MTTISSFIPHPSSFVSPFALRLSPLLRLYNKHSELFSNLTIVSLNSILLVSKIFQQIPRVIPRTALVVFSYTGIISLNAQIKSLLKSSRDLGIALNIKDPQGMLFTSLKVSVKGLNIILTCSMFAAAIIALIGFPSTTLAIYGVLRPFAVGGWVCSIANEVCDYQLNRKVVSDLNSLKTHPNTDERVHSFVLHFFHLIKPTADGPLKHNEDRKLAARVLRQMGDYEIENYQESIDKLALKAMSIGKPLQLEQQTAWHYYQNIQASLDKQMKVATANLGLRAINYAALGVCRMYPDSIAQWSLMWGISVLYTAKHIYEKYKCSTK